MPIGTIAEFYDVLNTLISILGYALKLLALNSYCHENNYFQISAKPVEFNVS